MIETRSLSLLIEPVPAAELASCLRLRTVSFAELGSAAHAVRRPCDRHSRFFRAVAPATGELVGLVGVTPAGAPAYGFEEHIDWSEATAPGVERGELVEGHSLYVAPKLRRHGLGVTLALLAPLLAQDAGAAWIVMETAKTDGTMIDPRAWVDSGTVTELADRPFRLLFGQTEDVLARFGPLGAAVLASGQVELTPSLRPLFAALVGQTHAA